MANNWIRERRNKLDISQEELATQLQIAGFDVTSGSISHWENDRHDPPLTNPDFRKALAQALKISIPNLLSSAGFEVSNRHSDDAMRAADIVDQLPDGKRELALNILEQILKGA